jgi:hypothetical protein
VTLGLVVMSLAIRTFVDSAGYGYDYLAYDTAARRIVDGVALYPPDTAARYAQGAYEGLYLYPPPMAIALAPLTLTSTETATLIWMLLRVVVLTAAISILPVSRATRALTFAAACVSFPVLFDLNIGNVSVVVLALAAVAWRTSGTAVAALAHALLIAIRFPFGIFFLEWFAQSRWRAIGMTIAAGLLLIALSLPIVGATTYVDYVTILRSLPDISTGPHNLSLKSTALELGLPAGLATASMLVGYAAGLGSIFYAGRRRDDDVGFVVTALATLLVSPFIHPHYLVLLLLPAALLMDRGRHWAVMLPLLGWLPDPALPLIAPAVIILVLVLGRADSKAATPAPRSKAQASPMLA